MKVDDEIDIDVEGWVLMSNLRPEQPAGGLWDE
jgi:hypothetical protein